MKKLLLSTALLAGMSAPALAQDGLFRNEMTAGAVRASDLIGARIYASETTVDADEYAGVQEGWNDIGEINDVIVSRDGKVDSVLVDIGGFLGMGERQVAVDMTAVRFVSDGATADNADDWFLVMNADRATLEAAPQLSMATDPAMTTADAPAEGDTAMATTEEGTIEGAATDGTARAPMMRDGYTAAAATELTAETLKGTTVYDANDAVVGEIGELVLTDDGQVKEVIIDVGGFLGMGEKPVALALDQVEILRQNDGSELRVYVSATKEQLEAMPDYQM
jgi:sporulation protein YlmC with PRC-barrel domain